MNWHLTDTHTFWNQHYAPTVQLTMLRRWSILQNRSVRGATKFPLCCQLLCTRTLHELQDQPVLWVQESTELENWETSKPGTSQRWEAQPSIPQHPVRDALGGGLCSHSFTFILSQLECILSHFTQSLGLFYSLAAYIHRLRSQISHRPRSSDYWLCAAGSSDVECLLLFPGATWSCQQTDFLNSCSQYSWRYSNWHTGGLRPCAV